MGKGQSKLTTSQVTELSQVTHFLPSEIKYWFKAFTNDCPTGALSQSDFNKIYEHFFPFGKPTEFSTYVFSVFDRNRDGLITFPEFLKALSVTSRGSTEEKLDWAFDLYDVDEDGLVGLSEMVQILKAINMMVGGIADIEAARGTAVEFFDRMGKTDKDTLSKDEFREGAMLESSVVHALSLYNGLV